MKFLFEVLIYSCLCKCSVELNIKFCSKVCIIGFVDIVVDSIGFKVFGEGEWYV